MANEIRPPANDIHVDVDQTPGVSRPSAQAAEYHQNEPRSSIMHETNALLLDVRDSAHNFSDNVNRVGEDQIAGERSAPGETQPAEKDNNVDRVGENQIPVQISAQNESQPTEGDGVNSLGDNQRSDERSVQAADKQNEERNHIMYQTTAKLLAHRNFGSSFVLYYFLFSIYGAIYVSGFVTSLPLALVVWGIFMAAVIMLPQLAAVIITPRCKFFLFKRKFMYFFRLRMSVSACTFGVLLVIIWYPVKHHPEGKKADIVLYTAISLTAGSILWLVKSYLLLELASSFCIDSFFERAKESLAHEYIMTALSRSLEDQNPQPQTESLTSATACERLFKPKVTIDILEVMKVPGHEFPLFTKELLVMAISDSVTWSFQKDAPPFMKSEQKTSEAARPMFKKAANGKSYIDQEDLKRLLTAEIFGLMLPMLEVDKDGHISSESFSKWMVKAYNFRMVLKRAVANNKRLFKRLVTVLNLVLIAGIIVLWLALKKIIQSKTIILILPQMAATAFIFGESIKKAFEGVVYTFLVHPFDVGDCCVIGNDTVLIESMGILKTSAKKFDGQVMLYPSATLATLPICNYTRSPHMGDSLEFSIDIRTPLNKITHLKDKIKGYFKENAFHWDPDEHSLVIKGIDGMDKLKMVLNFKHTIIFREFVVRDERRFVLIMALTKFFKEVNLNNEVSNSENENEDESPGLELTPRIRTIRQRMNVSETSPIIPSMSH